MDVRVLKGAASNQFVLGAPHPASFQTVAQEVGCPHFSHSMEWVGGCPAHDVK